MTYRFVRVALLAAALPAAFAADAPAPRNLNYNTVTTEARSPEEQRGTFALPAGFEIELVAAESPGIGKFVALAWDARMRLWTTTALEYPVDGNEQKSTSDALFAAGGRDRVVVFDNVYGAEIGAAAKPRVFAEGLVMPLGVQPWRDGALVQYGADIRFYRDTDGDGRADRHEVVLTGFGTQDSHLFPHQFLRQPGDMMFVAQGLFNYSTVRRPGGAAFADGATEVAFNQCKLAVMALDGSRFENVTAGPNNIWGLLTSREGETFLQEANDIGYPVIPYAPGIWVATGSRERLRPYQPLMPPPLGPAQMGGTGLSGLALAEDRDGLFRRFGAASDKTGTKVFFLANPITNTINAVRATPTADGARYAYEKLPDFLTATDKRFRPVAMAFGPDGALYVVDWYNKIISHNEVPRAHPDRDKTRGRIWRIRHRDQPRATPPDLTRLADRALLDHLDHPNALVARLAWLEIGDRRAMPLAPALETIAADRAATLGRRLAALWALEGLRPVPVPLLRTLAADPTPALRREAARLAGFVPRSADFSAVATQLAADPHPLVRAALGDTLRRVPHAAAAVAAAALLARAPLPAVEAWPRYEREFERYLARWAMETHPAATRALLAGTADDEARALAALALGDRPAALRLAEFRPRLSRPLEVEEIRLLARHHAEPPVGTVLGEALSTPATRPATLRALLETRAPAPDGAFSTALTAAARAQLTASAPADQALGAEITGAFRLTALTSDLGRLLETHGLEPRRPVVPAALRALADLQAGDPDLLAHLAAQAPEPGVRDDALTALLAQPHGAIGTRVVGLLTRLAPAQRGRALHGLSGSPAGAEAIAAGLRSGAVAEGDLGLSTLERLRALRPEEERFGRLWQRLGGDNDGSEPWKLTPAEAAAEAAKFARFRTLANTRGNPERGKELFNALCLGCHAFAGQGGQIAPPLDGVGHTGVDAMLRNILTPSAAMEGAYRTFRVVLRDGAIIDGFLVEDTADAVVVRIPGSGERRLARRDVRSAGHTRRSLMPDGLLEGLAPEQVSDLFAHLKSLR